MLNGYLLTVNSGVNMSISDKEAKNSLKFFGTLLIVITTILLYYPSLYYLFLNMDDGYYLVNNPGIRNLSWDGIKFLFLEDQRDIRYFPITYLSFAIEYYFFEFDSRCFHLTNVVLHSANALLVVYLMNTLFRNRCAAFITGLLFAIHPIQIEAVAWVMSRKNVLFFFFYLLSLISYIYYFRGRTQHSIKAALLIILSIVLFLLSGMTKATAITLPAVLLLIDYVLEPDASLKLIAFAKRHIPSKLLYIPVIIFLYIMNNRLAQQSPFITHYDFGWWEWLLITGHNIMFYVYKALVPVKLAIFYPIITEVSLPWHYYLFTLLTFFLIIIAVWSLKRYKAVFWGIAFYLVTIFPMAISLLLLSDLPVLAADRYFYQASVGVFLLAGLGISFVWKVLKNEDLTYRILFAIFLSFTITVIFWLSKRQLKTWKNTISVLENEVKYYPSDQFIYWLAIEYDDGGKTEKALATLDKMEESEYSILFSKFFYFQFRLFHLYYQKGELSRAAEFLEAAIESTPNKIEPTDARSPLAYFFLANLWNQVGDTGKVNKFMVKANSVSMYPNSYFEFSLSNQSPVLALEFFQRHLENHPDDCVAWFFISVCYRKLGNEDKADESFTISKNLGFELDKIQIPEGFSNSFNGISKND